MTEKQLIEMLYALGKEERMERAWRARQETDSQGTAPAKTRTPQCPSVQRMEAVCLEKAVWTAAEEEHVGSCRHCRLFLPLLKAHLSALPPQILQSRIEALEKPTLKSLAHKGKSPPHAQGGRDGGSILGRLWPARSNTTLGWGGLAIAAALVLIMANPFDRTTGPANGIRGNPTPTPLIQLPVEAEYAKQAREARPFALRSSSLPHLTKQEKAKLQQLKARDAQRLTAFPARIRHLADISTYIQFGLFKEAQAALEDYLRSEGADQDLASDLRNRIHTLQQQFPRPTNSPPPARQGS